MTNPDSSITWNGFVEEFSTKSTSNSLVRNKFESNFRNKVIKWEGTVMRVDSFDEDVEFDNRVGPGKGKVTDPKAKENLKALNIHSTDS